MIDHLQIGKVVNVNDLQDMITELQNKVTELQTLLNKTVTTDTAQTITGAKTYKTSVKIQPAVYGEGAKVEWLQSSGASKYFAGHIPLSDDFYIQADVGNIVINPAGSGTNTIVKNSAIKFMEGDVDVARFGYGTINSKKWLMLISQENAGGGIILQADNNIIDVKAANVTTTATPTQNTHLTTKKYVDELIAKLKTDNNLK